MRKWLAFSIVGILLLSILQGGHGFLDSLLMLLFFLIFDGKGHIVVGLLVLALLVAREVRARRARELAGKQLVEVIRQRIAAMEAQIALLEGRAPNVREEGDKDGLYSGIKQAGRFGGGCPVFERAARPKVLWWPAALERQRLVHPHSPERQGLIRPGGMEVLRPGMWVLA